MVKAIIDVNKETNKLLNVLKAEYSLRDKSEAINKLAREYERFVKIGPQIRPEYIRKFKRIRKQNPIKIGTIEDFKNRYGLK